MSRKAVRAWSLVHKWTSLICTVFLMMLCVTGLPLVFHDEIDGLTRREAPIVAQPGQPVLNLDQVLDTALKARSGEVGLFMSFDIDRPVVNVTTGPRADSPGSDMRFMPIDRTSGDPAPPVGGEGVVMEFILQLHTDMFLGLPGMLFLGFMGLLFAAAIVSGVVLYAPFMKRLDFGEVRREKSARVKWLDYHNLLGVVATGWLLVVGLTGVINTLEQPILDAWRYTELADLVAQHEGPPLTEAPASLDAAVARAVEAAPGMELQFVSFPGSAFSTDGHYAVFLHGKTPLTEHIITPALIDAADGAFEGLREMPWYVKALSLSRPLHFGDYGGLFLKIIWALLDIATIVILASGVYLWLAKKRVGEKRFIEEAGAR